MNDDINKKIEKIEKALRKKLKLSRYYHTISVANSCALLASINGIDINKAYLCGLLHDCAKYMTGEEMLKMAKDKKVSISEIEAIKPDLLHAKLGSYLAIKKYKVKDEDINSAILCHTTGKPDMSLLDKILYISDYIAYGRDEIKLPRLPEVRKVAFTDIDECLKMILSDSVDYLEKSGMVIDNKTKETYEYYCL